MLTEIYIEAYDEELADQVWEVWDVGEIDEATAFCQAAGLPTCRGSNLPYSGTG